ncbi:HNH endonuclease signature motif containing protein [Paenibacillus donghaensis]|uniref:HNH domain-containing protein n=1 Tax=Paenibacillus donghaensis TaxID=414771 RepID=A0A2Z2KK13_9BACL|nr:HNH endonuclease signature motif containing protein [Paenibacillus donghaensis]ASA22679.1 hypothetical protein B9T62_18910 [Paenibacillus donghaensis]
MIEELRKCTKCKNSYPASIDYFYKLINRNKKKNINELKLTSWCKTCFIESRKEFQKKNYNEGDQKLKKYHQDRRIEKGEQIRKRERDYSRQHKEMRAEYQKLWQNSQNGKMKARLYMLNRENKKHDIKNEEWNKCKEYFDYCCAYCGMPIEIHRKRIKKDFAREHAINLGANDLSNCIPSCFYCNSEKNISDYTEWYNENNCYYDVNRYQRITKWLETDFKKYISEKRKDL